MAYSGNIVNYLGHGTIADRPASLNIHPDAIGFYRADDEDKYYVWNGAWVALTASAAAAWGSITGTLASQVDLKTALDAKLDDAPNDGKQYARKDAAWSEVTGGGGGLPNYKNTTISALPGLIHNSVSNIAQPGADNTRTFMLPPGDYTGMSIGLVPADTTVVSDIRIALYQAGTTLAGGALIKDLGRVQRASGAAVAILKTPVSIGILTDYAMLAVFFGSTAGATKSYTVIGSFLPIPESAKLSFTSTAWRGLGTLTYPAGGAIPANLPTYTVDYTASFGVFLWLVPS